jgi:tRNA 2-thiouridine synthesizing protein A
VELLPKRSEQQLKPDHTLDCIGLFCPEPVFQTRQALDRIQKGEVLEVWANDPAAEIDIKSLVKRLQLTILGIEKHDDKLRLLIQK